MTRIVLVRHGETIWHTGNRYAGASDIPLTERGHRQAAALARWSATAGLSALYVSPLTRARSTIAPVEAALHLSAVVDPRLRELDFGQGEGRTAAEMRRELPDAYSAFERDPVTHPLPNGEDPRHAITRARAALVDTVLSAPVTGSSVLVVAHSTLIRLLLCDTLDINPARYRRVFPQLNNVALTELGFTRSDKPTQGSDPASLEVSLLAFNCPLPETVL